jgi:hypothetical protein
VSGGDSMNRVVGSTERDLVMLGGPAHMTGIILDDRVRNAIGWPADESGAVDGESTLYRVSRLRFDAVGFVEVLVHDSITDGTAAAFVYEWILNQITGGHVVNAPVDPRTVVTP